MEEVRRSTAARLGIVALNLLAPGLGLVRLGHGRAGLAWLTGVTALIWMVPLLYAVGPVPTFPSYVVSRAVLLLIALACYVVTMIWTWRASGLAGEPGPWWTRWYALVGLWLLVSLFGQGAVELANRYYKSFYGAAESMTPTIALNDRFFANMHGDQPVHRGSVLLFDHGDQVRILRVVGLPGERVAMRSGVPVINGVPAFRRFVDEVHYEGVDGPAIARRFEEKLPGEKGAHFILDREYVPMTDEMSEIRVPPGRYFVMGDSRDRAADSRVPASMSGIGLPSRADIRGRPMFFYWSTDRSKIGEPVDP
jgi:signal peptidase I